MYWCHLTVQPSPASKILQRHYSTLYQCVKTNQSVAEILHHEIQALVDVQYSSVGALLVAIQDAVCSNHKNLQVIGRALGNIATGTAKFGSDILKDYGK